MCACTLVPVYSSKVDLQLPSNPSTRRFLQSFSTLCLQCILSLGELPKLPLRQYCTASMRREWEAYYSQDQLDDDPRNLRQLTATDEMLDTWIMDVHQRLVPTMGQLGWQLGDDGLRWSRRLPSPEAQ